MDDNTQETPGRGVNFDRIFRHYYERERKRSEDCIGSIINILTPSTETDSQKISEIIDTIIKHYSRV